MLHENLVSYTEAHSTCINSMTCVPHGLSTFLLRTTLQESLHRLSKNQQQVDSYLSPTCGPLSAVYAAPYSSQERLISLLENARQEQADEIARVMRYPKGGKSCLRR